MGSKPPHGPLVLWFHGTPGARRQIPPIGRDAACDLGLRIVSLERPGVGDSTEHIYEHLSDWAADVAIAAEQLGHEHFMVVGLSGGGPYALACAHQLPSRVVGVGLLGSVLPVTGDEITAEDIVTLALRFHDILNMMRRPLGIGLWGFVQVGRPFAYPLVLGFARIMPQGDRLVLSDREFQAMFVDDLVSGARRQFQAMVNDVVLLGKPWGFSLSDVTVPVRWCHGDADPFGPLEQAQRAAALLPDVELRVRHGESHLGGFAAADEVLTALSSLWHETMSY